MMTCPACGKDNEDSAFECRRCRAPLREDLEAAAPAEPTAHAAPAEEAATSSDTFGQVCRRCEAYNEPGTRRCTSCGLMLIADEPANPPEEPLDKTPPEGSRLFSDELSALSISAEDAAAAGLDTGNGVTTDQQAADRTPPEAFEPPRHEARPPPRAPPPPPPRSKGAEAAAGAALAGAATAAAGFGSSRRSPAADAPIPVPPPKAPEPPAEKACANCGASNPPAAKFCFDCGTPFARKPEPPKASEPPQRRPPPRIEPLPTTKTGSVKVAPSIEIDAELAGAAESTPMPVEAPPVEEAPAPFQASLVVEKGSTAGTVFALGRMENSIGGSGTHLELGDDPFVAPHAATLLFAEDRLVVRDEGGTNGVFVKVHDSAPLQPGDLFIAGERLLRYDGPFELARNGEVETPFLGAPRPQGTATVRVIEVLGGGKTGRTCHRAGPVITIGRSGCDMNFPTDSLLAAKHAEIRLGDESATLVDLGQGPSGVLVRVRPQQTRELQGGDMLQIGDQLFRVEIS
jgi:pSer/pThr/pTyr-binding forkhead associated (FHA) protein/ribosomal protein L40E